jgi:hypothetical protein
MGPRVEARPEHRVCFKVLLDPSTPLSSMLEASTVKGVARPLVARGEEPASQVIGKCGGECHVVAVVDAEGRVIKAVSYYRLAAMLASRGDFKVSEAPSDVPVLGVDSPVQRLIEEIVLHGAPVLVVDHRGRPLYSVDNQIMSQLLQEEIDVEEIRGAD